MFTDRLLEQEEKHRRFLQKNDPKTYSDDFWKKVDDFPWDYIKEIIMVTIRMIKKLFFWK